MAEEAKIEAASEAPPVSAEVKANWKWYVIHTYSGYEAKAKAALEERVRSMQGRRRIVVLEYPIARGLQALAEQFPGLAQGLIIATVSECHSSSPTYDLMR